MYRISWNRYEELIRILADKILKQFPDSHEIMLCGIPRGGQLIALRLSYKSDRFVLPGQSISDNSQKVCVDDILATGHTRELYKVSKLIAKAEDIPFAVLVDKSFAYDSVEEADISSLKVKSREWVLFPYEDFEKETRQEAKEIKRLGEEKKSDG